MRSPVALLRSVYKWIEDRAGFAAAVQPIMDHQVPRSTASWWYVFGSATLALFMLQIATGICLALVYVPSADEAYQSLVYLNYQAPFGWYLRAMHFWGSNAMVAVMTLHMIQVFLFGAHKYPREMTWVVGVLLFLCTLGMAFTGQVLRWDQDAYWGLGIGASIAARSPGIGDQLVHLLLGGPIIAGRTLSRFFAVHVFAVPGILFALIGVHLWLVLRLGINEWPMPGRLVDRETYRQRYEEEVHKDGVSFFPYAARKDMVGMGVVTLIVLVCAAVFGPHGPRGFPDPTLIDTAPKPDFYFLALFSVFALLAAVHGDGADAGGPGHRHRPPVPGAVHRRHRREELEAAAGGRARGDPDRAHRHHAWPASASTCRGRPTWTRGARCRRRWSTCAGGRRSRSRARSSCRTSSAAPATASGAAAASAGPPSTAWRRG